VFNHVSYLDGLVVAAAANAPATLAKASLAAAPFLGRWTRAMQMTVVDRSRGGGTVAALAAHAADARRPPVAVAPEGTTKPARGLLAFRTGAFVGGRPVLPIVLDYRAEAGCVNPGWGVTRAAWLHLLRLQAAGRVRVTATVLPLFVPTAEQAGDPRAYAEAVRREMAAAVGMPLLPASSDDWAALKRAGVYVDWTGRELLARGREVGGKG
jgi:lysophosphatidylcholine acyltransferase/lyso-PAF acetyltransferase